MDQRRLKRGPFPEAHEDAKAAKLHVNSPQTRSPSYKLAYQDEDFLLRAELRPVRLQLELLKPEIVQSERGSGRGPSTSMFSSRRERFPRRTKTSFILLRPRKRPGSCCPKPTPTMFILGHDTGRSFFGPLSSCLSRHFLHINHRIPFIYNFGAKDHFQ